MAKPAYISLSKLQAVRKAALLPLLLIGLAVIAVTQATWFGDAAHEWIEYVGIGLIVICILGRCWCSLYIGGKKVRELITNGPYSIVRNPLYFFSFLGAAGVGAQSGSLVIAAVCVLLCWIVFATVVSREETALVEVHGEAYAAYLKSTPRFLPNPWKWHDKDEMIVQPDRVVQTFADGLFFLLAIPLAEYAEHLQQAGVLPVLMNLP